MTETNLKGKCKQKQWKEQEGLLEEEESKMCVLCHC